MSSDLLSIVLPVYNEEDCVGATIDEIEKVLKAAKIHFEIIVVDDGSTDSTPSLVQRKKVTFIQHRKNLGVGAARKTGVAAAKGKYIFMTDADGTYPIDQMPRLLRLLKTKDLDMVVGARTGQNVVYEWPHRSIPKFFIRALASYISQVWIPDLNSGFRVFKRKQALRFTYLLPDSHSWVSTITLAFLCNRLEVEFTPIDYFKRKGGQSSFSPIKDTYNYISLVVRTALYFHPLRLFIPLSLLILLGGGIKIIYDWNVYGWIGSLDVIIFITGFLVILVGLLADLIVVQGRRNEHQILQRD